MNQLQFFFLRLELISCGLSRSSGVILEMKLQFFLTVFLPDGKSFLYLLFLSPEFGSIPRIWSIEQTFSSALHIQKVVKENSALRIFFSSSIACFSSKTSCARSTRETISPIPRILVTIRSGWKIFKSI